MPGFEPVSLRGVPSRLAGSLRVAVPEPDVRGRRCITMMPLPPPPPLRGDVSADFVWRAFDVSLRGDGCGAMPLLLLLFDRFTSGLRLGAVAAAAAGRVAGSGVIAVAADARFGSPGSEAQERAALTARLKSSRLAGRQ